MISRIVMDGGVRREFGLCEKCVKLRSAISCFDGRYHFLFVWIRL